MAIGNRIRDQWFIHKEVIRMKGIGFVFWLRWQHIIGFFAERFGWQFYRRFGKAKLRGTFQFQGKSYQYFSHPYNAAWRNERIIEVPIISEIINNHKGKSILEVGNVLSHYFTIKHTILDKYEKGSRVINQDALEYTATEKYDLIVSISTLEHIGWFWYENPRTYRKVCTAIENLTRALKPSGKMVITIPKGQNFKLDELIRKGEIQFDELYCLKRISRDNQWVETTYADIQNIEYGKPFPGANAVVIGIINKISNTKNHTST